MAIRQNTYRNLSKTITLSEGTTVLHISPKILTHRQSNLAQHTFRGTHTTRSLVHKATRRTPTPNVTKSYQKVTYHQKVTQPCNFYVCDCFLLWTTYFSKFQGCLYQKLHAKSYQEVTEKLQALLGELASLPSPIPVRGGLREARGGGGPRGGRVWAFRTPRILELSALYISPHPLPPVLRAALFGSIPL